jgi:serine protease Do
MTIVVTPAQRESSALQANDQETNGQDEGNSQNDKPRPESNANYLGIEVEELTSDLIESYGLPEDTTGVVVASIEPTSSAWEKGLMEGSVIVMINDGEVQNLDDYDRLMSAAHDEWQSSGRNVILRYLQPDPSGNWIRFFVALPFED